MHMSVWMCMNQYFPQLPLLRAMKTLEFPETVTEQASTFHRKSRFI